MTALFSQNIYKKLLQNGFQPIQGMSHKEVLDNENKFIGLLKTGGPVWYAVVLINGDIVSEEEFRKLNSIYTDFFNQIQQQNNLRNLFILNLIYSQSYQKTYTDLILKQKPFEEQAVNHIYWAIVLDNGDFIYNIDHPTQILNLRKLIEESYSQIVSSESKQGQGVSIKSLNEVAYSETPYKEKVKNPILPYILIICNLIIFTVMEMSGGTQNTENLIRFGALLPIRFMSVSDGYRLFTAMFIHIGIMHLFFNCLSLYIFGTRAEKYFGRAGFIIIYFFSGFTGSVFSLLFTNSVSAGASGAIYGLVGAMAVLTGKSKRAVEGLNYYTMIIYILVGIGLGFTTTYIDNFGHIGGLIGGIISSLIILWPAEKENKGGNGSWD